MNDKQSSLWSLPQPAIAFGFATLAATAISYDWAYADELTASLLFLPIPLLLLAEWLMPKRADWSLNWRDLAEDSFWVFATYLIWVPLFTEHYDTPITEAFVFIRDAAAFPFALEATTVPGLIVCAMIVLVASEFIYYWIHRLQHRVMFFWRMHATHHHIVKMSVARADRTHPLEFFGLSLGSTIALALLGASADVIAVTLVFRLTCAHINHCNLPFTPGIFGVIFTTPTWHQVHHSLRIDQSNSNFGCVVILWDRVFGTFDGSMEIEHLGNGSGKPLSIEMQLTMAFRSNETLKTL